MPIDRYCAQCKKKICKEALRHCGRTRFCSVKCYGASKTTSPQKRLEKKSRLLSNGCIEWTGHKSKYGYGVIEISGKTKACHRVAWELHNGTEIPSGMFVCHSCDNPPCINPEHLWIGTASDNNLDAIRKGRRKTACYPPAPGQEVTESS